MRKTVLFYWMFFFVCVSLIVTSCQVSTALLPSGSTSGATQAKLKIAVIPVLDTLPMFVAQKEGLFKSHGVDVEFIPVASGAERDQLVMAGQADGMLNEILSTILFNKDKPQVQVVRFARAATANSPLFRILASPKSGITTVEGLKGIEIGVSDGTVIAYLTDRMLQKSNFKPGEIKTIGVPKIPERLSLLNSGQLKAAVLPDPTSSLAIQQGSVVILDDTIAPELSFSTISFRKKVIDENPDAIRGFLAAVEEATRMINDDASGVKYIPVLSEQKLVPAPLLQSFKIPKFVTGGVPSQVQYNDVIDWAKTKGILKGDVSYDISVNSSYLPPSK